MTSERPSNFNAWECGENKCQLVSTGTQPLFLQASGPPRKPGAPAVIIEAGLGDSSTGWAAVQRLVANYSRVFVYDRAGYGRSEASPAPRTATNIAKELSALLQACDIRPPYVLVGHSYGGILVREFLALQPQDIAGMVLVDANQEQNYIDCAFPWPAFFALAENLDYYSVRGIDRSHKLTTDEWNALLHKETQDELTAEREIEYWQSSADKLGKKRQLALHTLGDTPVSVIKGNGERELREVVAAGIRAGNGNDKQRAEVSNALDGFDSIEEWLQREQMSLSSRSRYTYARSSGHNVHLTQLEVIAEEVKWVLDCVESGHGAD